MRHIHEGFHVIQERIARKQQKEHPGESSKEAMSHAGRILASRSRSASKSARRKNPRLNRVKG